MCNLDITTVWQLWHIYTVTGTKKICMHTVNVIYLGKIHYLT